MNKFLKIHEGKENEENLMRERDMYMNISYFFSGGYS